MKEPDNLDFTVIFFVTLIACPSGAAVAFGLTAIFTGDVLRSLGAGLLMGVLCPIGTFLGMVYSEPWNKAK